MFRMKRTKAKHTQRLLTIMKKKFTRLEKSYPSTSKTTSKIPVSTRPGTNAQHYWALVSGLVRAGVFWWMEAYKDL